MSKADLEKQLLERGEQAIRSLARELRSVSIARVQMEPVRSGSNWTLSFDVLLEDGKSYIEFTAIQTGWGGDLFEASYETKPKG